MSVYADSSLLISYHITGSHSSNAQSLIHSSDGALPFTGLHHLEMRNALALGVFRRILTPAQVNAAWSDVERDLRSGRLLPRHVRWQPTYRAAAQWASPFESGCSSRASETCDFSLNCSRVDA